MNARDLRDFRLHVRRHICADDHQVFLLRSHSYRLYVDEGIQRLGYLF